MLEAFNLVVFRLQVVAGSSLTRQLALEGRARLHHNIQLEKRVRNLQHQDMWVVMFVADEDTFARSPHAMLLVVLL